jgi:hypothetical protein
MLTLQSETLDLKRIDPDVTSNSHKVPWLDTIYNRPCLSSTDINIGKSFVTPSGYWKSIVFLNLAETPAGKSEISDMYIVLLLAP